jgi:hypothetical protein
MDTRFWGPYGWKFLHTLPYAYNPRSDKERGAMKGFLKLLGEMLPCIYCRRSYTQYYKEMPVDNHLGSVARLEKWMYELHNKVNGKLRGQGILKTKNPSFKCIQSANKFLYENETGNKRVPGINFIYIIAFHYRNTTIRGKKQKYKKFFNYLSKIIHLKHIRGCLEKNMRECGLDKAGSVYCWWDKLYKKCDLNCDVCMEKCRERCFANVSGCKKKGHKGKTCRRIRSSGGKKVKTRKAGSHSRLN